MLHRSILLPCPYGITCCLQGDSSHVQSYSHSSAGSSRLQSYGLTHSQPQHMPPLFHHIAGGGVAGSSRLQSYGLTPYQPQQQYAGGHAVGGHAVGGHAGGGHAGGGHAGGGHAGGGHAGGGHGGAGWLLIDPRYSQGLAFFLVMNHKGQFENLYGKCDPGESHFRTAKREGNEETKMVFEFAPLHTIPHVQSEKYRDQRLYYCNVQPAPGQKSGLKTRELFANNDQVLRQIGAGREYFETIGLVRFLIADLQRVFAANIGNKGLVLVGTHGERGVLKGRDASYLRQILASNLHSTAPTLHSTFVRHANGIQTYRLQ